MKNKFYHRGQGECVVPTMEKPEASPLFNPLVRWMNHIEDLPVTAHCPSTAPIGFLDGWVEGYEALDFLGKGAMPGWYRVSKIEYDSYFRADKRIFLTPPVSTGERKEEEKGKHNPESKIDAYCYEIEDKLRVLRALDKANDRLGITNQLLLIQVLLTQMHHHNVIITIPSTP